MTDPAKLIKVAVAQPRGFPFRPAEAVDRVCQWTAEAGAEGARLVLFPEAFIGGYPWGLTFGTSVGGRSDVGRRGFERYWRSAIEVPGPETQRMGEAAAMAGVFLAVGVIERDATSGRGTLFCTLVYFGPDGSILGKHRKLKPTAAERLIWGEGDGSTMPVLATDIGRIGGLICWENYMPLARMALYGKGVELYLAPTADSRDRWQATLRHIALEGRCFVLGCNQYVEKGHYPEDLEILAEVEGSPEVLCKGGSAVYGPLGESIAGPLEGKEGLLYAELDLSAVPRGKFDFDVVGHYARPDVFRLLVNEAPQESVTTWEEEGS